MITTRTGVHRCHQLETAGIADRPACPRNRDRALFQWFSQLVQYPLIKLAEFVQEKNSMVRKRYFAG